MYKRQYRDELDCLLARGAEDVASAEENLLRKRAAERVLFERSSDAQYDTLYVEQHAQAMTHPQRWQLMRELVPQSVGSRTHRSRAAAEALLLPEVATGAVTA